MNSVTIRMATLTSVSRLIALVMAMPAQCGPACSEVSGLGLEVTIAEYRNGNEPENHVRKMNGIYKASDVTLKRGVIGVTDFFDWIRDVRDGAQNVRSSVTIELMDEALTGPVMTWKLTNARPMKDMGATLNAKGGQPMWPSRNWCSSYEKLDVE